MPRKYDMYISLDFSVWIVLYIDRFYSSVVSDGLAFLATIRSLIVWFVIGFSKNVSILCADAIAARFVLLLIVPSGLAWCDRYIFMALSCDSVFLSGISFRFFFQ